MATTDQSEQIRCNTTAFVDQAKAVMTHIRTSLRGLLTTIPSSGAVQSPKDLQRALGINYKLAWQIHRIAMASNPIEEAVHVPGAAAFGRFLESARKKGNVPDAQIAAAQEATTEFENLVHRHAGTRSAFDSMVSGLAAGGVDARIDLNQRKAAYRANSHIWGIGVRARIACILIQPNKDDPDFLDIAMVRGVVRLNQLRRDRPFTLSAVRRVSGNSVRPDEIDPEQFDSFEQANGINLIREFCSEPIPEIRNRMSEQGRLVTEIINRDVGESAAFTGFVCDVFRKCNPRYRTKENLEHFFCTRIQCPVEINVSDIFIRKGTYGQDSMSFRSETWSLIGKEDADGSDRDVLFVDNAVEHLGSGVEALHSTEYPRYVEMIKHITDRLGWDSEEFEAYRHRLMYPVMPSAVVALFDWPKKQE